MLGAVSKKSRSPGMDHRIQETRAEEFPALLRWYIRAIREIYMGQSRWGQHSLESPRQQFEAAKTKITGCTRRYLAGFPSGHEELGDYFLAGGDLVSYREHAREAFFRAQQGKEYIIPVNNKRRSRSHWWKRGCFWRKGGEWVPECHPHMQKSAMADSAGEQKSTSAHPKSPIKPNCGNPPCQ